MNTRMNNRIIGLVLGFSSLLGIAEPATAASDFKVIRQDPIELGDWEHHQPWRVIRFHLPQDFDPQSDVVLQMNLSSTNQSRYHAIYLNPEFIPGEFDGCDSIHDDRNEHTRIDFLPIVSHDQWAVYHKATDGAYLQPGDNDLLVCSRNGHGEGWQERDNFYLKDIVLQYREYEPAPAFCPAVYEPVCGVDGVTYSNACDADRARVEIDHEGEC